MGRDRNPARRQRLTNFTLTDTGAEVLACSRDFPAIHPIDLWLGGVHLTRNNLWRWDDTEGRLKSHKY